MPLPSLGYCLFGFGGFAAKTGNDTDIALIC